MNNLKLFVRLAKVDEAQRIVYGTAVDETTDFAKESFDYTTSKPYFEAWSSNISKATDGKSLGNVRAMHGKVAAGKLEQIAFDDGAKKIDVAAKVVDDNEWQKVLEGVYTGFSIGGRYEKKWKDGDITKYTADPCEISLVDMPCVPTATFQMVKSSGEVLEKNFKPGSEAVDEAVKVLAKSAGKDAEKDRGELEPLAREALAKDFKPGAVVQEVAEQAKPMPTNEQVVAKAADLAKAKGGTWMDHTAEAHAELVKTMEGTDNGSALGAGAAPSAGETKPAHQAPAPVAKAADADLVEGGGQVWVHPRLTGRTFVKKADMRAALVELEALEKAQAAAKPAADALAGILAKVGPKETDDMSDEDKAKAAAARKKNEEKKGAAKFAAEDLAKMLDGAEPIDSVEKLDAILAVEKIGDAVLKQRRTVVKAARALKALDKVPTAWVGKGIAVADDAGAELKKGASIYGLARMLELSGSIQCYEEDLESPYSYYGADVPADLKTRFGTLLVEFGDLCADILDVILTAVREGEAEEAMTRATAALDLLKGVAPKAEVLAKAAGGAPAPDAARVAQLEETLEAERSAFGKSMANMADQLTELAKRLERVEKQPQPLGTSSVTEQKALKVVEKGHDATGGAAPQTPEQMLSDPGVLNKLADMAVRAAHNRPVHAIPGHTG